MFIIYYLFIFFYSSISCSFFSVRFIAKLICSEIQINRMPFVWRARVCWNIRKSHIYNFIWKLYVVVDIMVANRVVLNYVVTMWFAFAIRLHYWNQYRIDMRHRCDVATTYANHPSSMMCDIDRIDLFDDNCGILSLAEQTAVDALCGWAIALLCIDVFCGRTKHTQNKTIYIHSMLRVRELVVLLVAHTSYVYLP